MKVGLYINDNSDAKFSKIDLSSPQFGNPGIGGTEYEFVLLAYALAAFSDAEVNFYHCNENKLSEGVNNWIVRDNAELLRMVKEHGNDVLVLRAMDYPALFDLYDLIRNSYIKCIAWSHNWLPDELMYDLYGNEAIKRIVMVSREHYDYYINIEPIRKSTYIFNMFDGRPYRLRDLPAEPAVTYTGGLYKSKSFHVFASMWKDILREVPDAKLYVVGSGKLYDHNAELGSLGVADKECEDMFAEYLMENGKLMPSVKFLGNMGQEKAEIYYKTTVGVTNFTPETFCISAVELEACGVPLVNMAWGGVLNTVKHNETGLLAKNNSELKEYIIFLLKDRELNIKLGRQAKEFADEAFLPENIVKQWLNLFDDVILDRPCTYIKPEENFGNSFKWFKVIDHWLMDHHLSLRYRRIKSLLKVRIKKNFPAVFSMLKKILKRGK